jgi:hypothetical protein
MAKRKLKPEKLQAQIAGMHEMCDRLIAKSTAAPVDLAVECRWYVALMMQRAHNDPDVAAIVTESLKRNHVIG